MSKRKSQPSTCGVTPGPYFVRDEGHGFHVTGKAGVSIAWVSTGFVAGGGESHHIDIAEAKANAELIRRAFEEQEKKGSST